MLEVAVGEKVGCDGGGIEDAPEEVFEGSDDDGV